MSAGDPTDAALAGLAAAGDERAFSRLVARHKAGLYRLLRRYTGDSDEAYEAVHETFIAAWMALGRYDANRAFLPWLRTIALNKARDRGRRMAVRRFFLGGDENELAVAVDPGQTADDGLQARQAMHLLDRAVSRLPDALKAPLLLTAFEGLSHQEAAAILGLSAKSVETRIYRARKALAASLDPTVFLGN